MSEELANPNAVTCEQEASCRGLSPNCRRRTTERVPSHPSTACKERAHRVHQTPDKEIILPMRRDRKVIYGRCLSSFFFFSFLFREGVCPPARPNQGNVFGDLVGRPLSRLPSLPPSCLPPRFPPFPLPNPVRLHRDDLAVNAAQRTGPDEPR